LKCVSIKYQEGGVTLENLNFKSIDECLGFPEFLREGNRVLQKYKNEFPFLMKDVSCKECHFVLKKGYLNYCGKGGFIIFPYRVPRGRCSDGKWNFLDS